MRFLLASVCAVLWLGCPAPSVIDAGEPEVDAGPFAYDARPANPTCVAPAPPPGRSAVAVERAFPNLIFNGPLGLFQNAGQPERLYVFERGGRVLSFPNDQDAGSGDLTVALDIAARVSGAGEGGLLGLAFHPRWPATAEVFVSYTAPGVGNSPLRTTLSRFKSSDGRTFDPASEEKLFELDQPYTNHNGGNIAFGPDGFLYLGLGDGGSGGDPGNHSQRLNTNLGKMLRLDVNVPFAERFRVPIDNPYALDGTPCNRRDATADQPAGIRCAEIYASGLRNPWRWSFDLPSGELWLGDVGQNALEEVDRIVRGGNYGWNVREGLSCYGVATCPRVGFVDPVIDYTHAEGASVTGGFVYRGTKIPGLAGRFIYGDAVSGRVFALEPTSDGMWRHTTLYVGGTTGVLASFGQLLDGEVYPLDLVGGHINKLVPMGAPMPDTFPQKLSQTGCFDAADPKVPGPGLIPYELNAPFWSDGARKERHFAIPDGTTINVLPDGDFDLPAGSVVAKTFFLNERRVETRLFMRHADGAWAGYSYEWNDEETDATLLPAGKTKKVGEQTWVFPSRAQCLQCHTAAAGRTLGLEVAQLNRPYRYPMGATRNEVTVLEGLGFFSAPLTSTPERRPKLEPLLGSGTLDLRARSWLHTNCSPCHRAGMGQGPADFRHWLPLKDTHTCDVAPENGDLGVAGARLIKPGVPLQSVVSLRVHALDSARMPPVGSLVVDAAGADLIDQWISSLTSCPQ